MIDYLEGTILKNRIARHALYWILYILFFGFVWGRYDHNYTKSIMIQLATLPAKILFVYIILYVLIPRYYIKKRIAAFFLSYILLLTAVTCLIEKPVLWFLIRPIFIPEWTVFDTYSFERIITHMMEVNQAALIPLVIVGSRIFHKGEQRAITLEKERIKSELSSLRNQIHPHFLFNTLNNLYSLIISKSKSAEDAVLKLSDLMRYMLYEADSPRVPVSKEIEYLKNYIDLEKLRFENGSNIISYIYEQDKEYEIAPFLLIPFVENAFKHASITNSISWVVISVLARNNVLTMNVSNEKKQLTAKNSAKTKEGVGLTNVKKRLDLLYTDGYDLEIIEDNVSYEVIFKLNLIPCLKEK